MKEPSNSQPKPQSYDYLSKAQQKSEGVASQWDQDNQQWWNWYMTLAENEHDQTNAAAKPARSGKYIFTPPGCKTIPLPPKRPTAADLMQAHAEQQRRVDRIQRLEASYLSGHYPDASSRTT